jgi:hypothetical protein
MSIVVSEVIERIRRLYHLKSESDVARKLKVLPQDLYRYKKKGTLPWQKIVENCDGHRLDEIFYGPTREVPGKVYSTKQHEEQRKKLREEMIADGYDVGPWEDETPDKVRFVQNTMALLRKRLDRQVREVEHLLREYLKDSD